MANPNNTQAKTASQSCNRNWQGWEKAASCMMDPTYIKENAGKNVEAMAAVGQVILGSMQALNRKNTEAMQHNSKKSWECMQNVCNCNTPREAQWLHGDFITDMVKSFYGNAKETMEVASNMALAMSDIWNKRTAEVISEWVNPSK